MVIEARANGAQLRKTLLSAEARLRTPYTNSQRHLRPAKVRVLDGNGMFPPRAEEVSTARHSLKGGV